MPLSPQEVADLVSQLGEADPEYPEGTGAGRGGLAFGRVADFREWPEGPLQQQDPLLAGRSKDELGQLDRFAMGKQTGERIPGGKLGGALLAGPVALAGGAIAGINELDKGLTGGRVAHGVLKALDIDTPGRPGGTRGVGNADQFLVDESSSPASPDNVSAFLRGILSGVDQRFGDVTGDDDVTPPLDSQYDEGDAAADEAVDGFPPVGQAQQDEVDDLARNHRLYDVIGAAKTESQDIHLGPDFGDVGAGTSTTAPSAPVPPEIGPGGFPKGPGTGVQDPAVIKFLRSLAR